MEKSPSEASVRGKREDFCASISRKVKMIIDAIEQERTRRRSSGKRDQKTCLAFLMIDHFQFCERKWVSLKKNWFAIATMMPFPPTRKKNNDCLPNNELFAIKWARVPIDICDTMLVKWHWNHLLLTWLYYKSWHGTWRIFIVMARIIRGGKNGNGTEGKVQFAHRFFATVCSLLVCLFLATFEALVHSGWALLVRSCDFAHSIQLRVPLSPPWHP